MKLIRTFALPLMLACATLTSCLKSEYNLSGYVTFVNIVDETHFIEDNGAEFLITENATDSDYMKIASKRMIINCDLLNLDNPRSVKLNAYKAVDVKTPLLSKNLPNDYVNSHADSLYVGNWYISSNGDNWYVTVAMSVPKLKDSKAEHEIDLVYDSASTKDQIDFILCHNANGDVYTKETKDEDKASEVVYMSFKVKDLIQDIFTSDTKLTVTSALEKKKSEEDNKKE